MQTIPHTQFRMKILYSSVSKKIWILTFIYKNSLRLFPAYFNRNNDPAGVSFCMQNRLASVVSASHFIGKINVLIFDFLFDSNIHYHDEALDNTLITRVSRKCSKHHLPSSFLVSLPFHTTFGLGKREKSCNWYRLTLVEFFHSELL